MTNSRFSSTVSDLIDAVIREATPDKRQRLWFGRQLIWSYYSPDRTFSGAIYRLSRPTPPKPFELHIEDERTGNVIVSATYATQKLAQDTWDRVKHLPKSDVESAVNTLSNTH